MEIKSIQTKKIYKNIVEQIVLLIREGSLKSGDKLPPERNLAEMLNVSRASLREALSVMEIMGIVDIRPGEGSFVSDLNVQPFISLVAPLLIKDDDIGYDLIEVRKYLECADIKRVADEITPDGPMLKKLKDVLDKMGESVEDANLGAQLDVEFHKIIFSMSQNTVLVKILEYLGFILEKTVVFNRNLLLREKYDAEFLFKQHSDIYNAIASGDGEQAAKEIENHLDYVTKVFKKNINNS